MRVSQHKVPPATKEGRLVTWGSHWEPGAAPAIVCAPHTA